MFHTETAIGLINAIHALLALTGAYLIACMAYTWEKNIDNTTLRAKVFLNDSFLKDIWKLLLVVFFLNAVMQIQLVPQMEKNISELMNGTAQLAVMAGIVLSEYKWFKLMISPGNHK